MKIKLDERKVKSLYVHIPFCEHICFYCDFVKTIKPKDPKTIDKYLNLLDEELKSYNDKLDNLQTIYIGGGTPSCLNAKQTEKMCKILQRYCKKDLVEYTIELNPESITKENLEIYKKYNINRLSIGVQTFDNDLLKKIGRIHDNSQAIEKYLLAREVGFDNISIDLMYNLFNQTKENVENDLKMIEKLKPDHISWYSLIMKENSVWGRRKLQLPENDELFDEVVNEGLTKLGYIRYEISNYQINGKASKHNISYWDNSLFVGVGVGATGFETIDGSYFLTVNKGSALEYTKEYEKLSLKDYYFQIIMMGLRMVEGIDLTDYINRNVFDHFKPVIEQNVEKGFLVIENDRLKCSKRGFDIMNEILIDFLD
ncbi:coproporphyrinogen III oxidase [Spiroplasma chinense]|uniref:Heme chaperone HemW n=1 Tax=Spiroplasma chinense TaxID=216932 RepID=A0A5B9Y6H5_9MOLU|nr:radical SAM family heme chaperone HemW [Spiroplasma chinense]QEH61682.1 coproporphyrinogen III oxidase [Spiroplasma chinense]